MLSNERLLLFDKKYDWEQDRTPKKNLRIHALMAVGPLYQYRDDAPMVPGPKLVWQFKIQENVIDAAMARKPYKFSAVLPIKEIAKIGMQTKTGAETLMSLIGDRVYAKEMEALRAVGGGGASRGGGGRGGGGSGGGSRYSD
jgi:uncharacterized membrane protein YgcG